jgi:hypothetical protein
MGLPHSLTVEVIVKGLSAGIKKGRVNLDLPFLFALSLSLFKPKLDRSLCL